MPLMHVTSKTCYAISYGNSKHYYMSLIVRMRNLEIQNFKEGDLPWYDTMASKKSANQGFFIQYSVMKRLTHYLSLVATRLAG